MPPRMHHVVYLLFLRDNLQNPILSFFSSTTACLVILLLNNYLGLDLHFPD